MAISATEYTCECEPGYIGEYCNAAAVVAVALATNALIAIIVSLLLLLCEYIVSSQSIGSQESISEVLI